MIIQTYDKEYKVLHYLESTSIRDSFICLEQQSQQEFLIVRLKEKEQYGVIMEYLYDQINHDEFTDFIALFVADAYLHLVFKAFQGESIKHILDSETITFKERIEMTKGVLEKMVLLDMPSYFQTLTLKPELITVSKSLDIDFVYLPDDIISYKSYTFDHVQDRLFELLTLIFRDEWAMKKVKPLLEFIQDVSKKNYKSYFDIYTSFCAVCDLIENEPEELLMASMHWTFRVWNKIKKTFKPIRRVVALTLWIVALLYMIMVINNTMQPSDEQIIYKYIGTVEIK